MIPTGRTLNDLAMSELQGRGLTETQLQRRFRIGGVKAVELKNEIAALREKIVRDYMARIPARR
jgi:hypothetical protein